MDSNHAGRFWRPTRPPGHLEPVDRWRGSPASSGHIPDILIGRHLKQESITRRAYGQRGAGVLCSVKLYEQLGDQDQKFGDRVSGRPGVPRAGNLAGTGSGGRVAGVPGGVSNKGKRGEAMRPATREPRGGAAVATGGWPPTPATGWHPSCPWASSASAPMKGAISYHYLHTHGAYNRGYQVGLGMPVKGWASAAEALA